MMNELCQTPSGTDELTAEVAAIDEALTDILLRIHRVRQRWLRDGEEMQVRLTLLAVEDIFDALTEPVRKTARLRNCLIR